MTNIRVGRYNLEQCPNNPWAGWIEPEDLGWIMFVKTDGSPVVFLNRDPATGAVLPLPESGKAPDSCYPGENWDSQNLVPGVEPPY